MSNIPSSMRAVIAEYNELHVLTMPIPVPQSTEVLIKVAAAGVSRPDILQRQGKYEPPKGITNVLGLEVSGEVVSVGADVQRWKIGDKVCALLAGGGYAQYAVAPAGQCLPIPDGMSVRDAALLPEAVFTVWANLFEAGQLKQDETVLVHGGASGIGVFAIQMARAIGANVIVTVGGPDKATACLKLGAAAAINHKLDDFYKAILDHTDGRGVDVVLDMIGGDYVPRNLSCLTMLGRHVSIATQHSSKAEIDIRMIMNKRLTLTGSTLRPRTITEKGRLAEQIEAHVWPWIAAGKVKTMRYQSFSLENAAHAHKVMESRLHIGKIGLDVAL
jgi:NADPH:quinone reductase